MKQILQKTALTLAVAGVLVSCGSGGGGVAGIGGSGFISDGSVTAFGSIFVNGVEFETDTANFDIEGIGGSQADLSVGMRVKVNGTVNADGITGTATSVKFEDQLEGPISSAITEDADLENKTFTVLGVTVTINSADTVFIGFDYNSIASGDNIQISGFFDDTGLLHATAIVEKNAFVANNTIVEAKGTISGLSFNTFTLTVGSATLTVDATTAGAIQVPVGLAEGQFVEVKGTISSAAATDLVATIVKLEDNDLDDGAEVEIEGIITRYVSDSDFDVDNHPVNAFTATRIPTGLTLSAGIKVEVEGSVTAGILQASKVKLREGANKVHATASNVNTNTNTFDMTIAGQTITVTVDTSTRMEDKLDTETLSQALTKLGNEFLRVRGFDDGTGSGIIATRVEIRNTDDVILQGVIQSQSPNTSVTVLGVIMPVDGTTDFQDITNTSFPGGNAEFIASITEGISLIKIKDKEFGTGGNPVDIADEVELQQP